MYIVVTLLFNISTFTTKNYTSSITIAIGHTPLQPLAFCPQEATDIESLSADDDEVAMSKVVFKRPRKLTRRNIVCMGSVNYGGQAVSGSGGCQIGAPGTISGSLFRSEPTNDWLRLGEWWW